jgi:transcriptional regulator with XRE-family HTH domain
MTGPRDCSSLNASPTSAARHRAALAFGAVLREVRHARGLSQETVADLSGLHRTYPSLLERGLRTPTLDAILRIADALRVPPETLIAGTRDRLRSTVDAS